MKAFLSYSSKDKSFVESVADLLRPGTFELDSLTFDSGLVNSEAIIRSLQRCDLFCLFLSSDSVTSSYVDFETLLGMEFLASGKIGRFLAICIDENAFEKASENVKFFNVVRKSNTIESIARLIQGNLISAAGIGANRSHPFIGREDELVELEKQITDHKRPLSKALFISGNFGAGRRTIAHKFYEDHYPNAGHMFPIVNLEQFAGLDELYRKILSTLRPSITASGLLARIQGYEIASIEEKRRLVAQLLNSLLPANEAALLIDKGGVLTDSGGLASEINEIISHLEAKPHPPAIVISPRMIPMKLRRSENDISYLAVRSLKQNATERLISKLLKDRDVSLTDEGLEDLARLSDGHPFNIYRMVEELVERGLKSFLANPSDFIDWKHRQSSEYLSKVTLTDEDILILGLLKLVPELDFTAIVTALEIDANAASDALLRLTNLHIVESSSAMFVVSPALRVAVERNGRIQLPSELRGTAVRTLAQSLSIRLEEGIAPVALVDAAVLSALESGGSMSGVAAGFLLPSHHVWMAKRHYDQGNWNDCIRYAKESLKGSQRLSSDAFVAACRYMCLSAARVGNTELFNVGIKRLKAEASDDWSRSNIAFLEGFNSRLKGNLPAAEILFRKAYALSPGNSSATREIAAICLMRDNLDEAEHFAREGYSHAPSNSYFIDILISVLIRKLKTGAKNNLELQDLFDVFEKVGDEEGRSFYTTRKAEFEHLSGNKRDSLRLIEIAISKTPGKFEPRKLHAEILLGLGNKTKAFETIKIMKDMVNARDPHDRKTNYRQYIEIFSLYFIEVQKFEKAKELYNNQSIFTEEERTEAIRKIEIVQGFKLR